MPRDDLETKDFLLSKAARLDRALRSLPKADLKSLQAASHKKARKLLRSLSYPARPQANGDTAETIQNRIDVLGTKSTAASTAKQIPPLTEALHMGPDMVSVQAFAIEARQPLAEDLCTEALRRTGANLDWVRLEPLSHHCEGRWPSLETFTKFYDIPPHLRPKPRTPPPPSEPSPEPPRPTIGCIEEAKAFGRSSDLLAALVRSLAGDPGLGGDPVHRAPSPDQTEPLPGDGRLPELGDPEPAVLLGTRSGSPGPNLGRDEALPHPERGSEALEDGELRDGQGNAARPVLSAGGSDLRDLRGCNRTCVSVLAVRAQRRCASGSWHQDWAASGRAGDETAQGQPGPLRPHSRGYLQWQGFRRWM
ncbi:unnamed protein product [Symbiodinium necroappetens]|uniref:Uncharacterized protein n=1 Tax=Symbiodinium necroappetens TaxID=1628268 RepID=A0A812YU86_9DINO|nr:unnamed protein product [Symbiodinium necroappetens]